MPRPKRIPDPPLCTASVYLQVDSPGGKALLTLLCKVPAGHLSPHSTVLPFVFTEPGVIFEIVGVEGGGG